MKQKKKVKKKLPSLSKMKREADKQFSLYIRAKYPKLCYTCLATGKTLQCGHFISRAYLSTRWNENNARPQCVGCNIWGRGRPLDFEERLKSEIGADEVEQLKLQRKVLIRPTRFLYTRIINGFSEKLANLTPL